MLLVRARDDRSQTRVVSRFGFRRDLDFVGQGFFGFGLVRKRSTVGARFCDDGNRRRNRLGAFGPRRIDVGFAENLRGEMARPARLIPAGQRARHLRIVEDDAVAIVFEQAVDLVEMRFDVGIEIDDDDTRAGFLQRAGIEIRRRRFVDDRRAERSQRVAQMAAELLRLVEQRDGVYSS